MNDSFQAKIQRRIISIFAAAITLQIFTIFLYITGTSTTSQAPPAVFWRIQPYLEFIDICIQANRLTLHQCTKINRFVCKISAFRTNNDRSFSVSSTSGWLRSHFEGRIFGKYGKLGGIWRVTKLYAYKGRIALFHFQLILWLLCIFIKKVERLSFYV